MGGRGAASGVSDKGKTYGSEYTTVFQSGNIKFVKPKEGSTTAPMETRTKGRIYVTLGKKDEPKFISFYNKENKRYKQIDLTGKPHVISGKPTLPHTHLGYEHNENGDYKVSGEDQKIIDKVLKIWHNYLKRQ